MAVKITDKFRACVQYSKAHFSDVHVEFDEPQRAIAKGQAVVLYDGDVVVGGGTIQ